MVALVLPQNIKKAMAKTPESFAVISVARSSNMHYPALFIMISSKLSVFVAIALCSISSTL
jgi:hypothetical protein